MVIATTGVARAKPFLAKAHEILRRNLWAVLSLRIPLRWGKRGRWSSGNLLEVKLMRRPGPNGGDCATQPGGRVEAGERALPSPWFET